MYIYAIILARIIMQNNFDIKWFTRVLIKMNNK